MAEGGSDSEGKVILLMAPELEISNSCDAVSEKWWKGDRPLARPILAPPHAPLRRWERPSAKRSGPGCDQTGLTPRASINGMLPAVV